MGVVLTVFEEEEELVIVAPEIILPTLTKVVFSSRVEELHLEKGMSYITCVDEVCVEFNIDYESVRKFLSKTLIQKITLEAVSENQLKREYCAKTTSLV